LVAVGIAILAAATRRRDAEAFKSATNHEHRE
jgi:hypothetical protein